MKVTNPNLAKWQSCWQHSDLMASKNFFLICFSFWFLLLFCRLLRRDLGELVSVMERNRHCSTKTFHVLCEWQICEGIDRNIYGEQRDVDWRSIYDVG
jgi:hypothetical protein